MLACLLAILCPCDTPNIVVILCDDLGYGDVAPYATDEKIPTPAFARLAAEGLTLTDAHSPCAWCTPTRYGLLTGRYPVRQDVMRDKQPVIPPDHATLPGFLRERGYETVMLGKWHLGFDGDDRTDPSRTLTGGPVDRGFDAYYGIPRSLDIPPYYWISDRTAVDAPTEPVEGNQSGEPWNNIQGAFWRKGLAAPGFEFADVTPEIGDRAVAEIGRREPGGKPLFLYVALPSPHTPWVVKEEFVGKSGAEMYGDFVVQVDSVVGDVLDALDRAGIMEDTLVFVSSDNGPVWYPQDTQRTGHDATAGFRGMKGDAHEGGHRVPALVRWPGRIGPGETSDALFCQTDLFATFAAILGGDLPDTVTDSVDQWPVWQGRPDAARTSLLTEATGRFQCVREGQWKLIPALGSAGFTKPKFRDPEGGEPPGQLYDLDADPSETTNVYADHPDVVARLTALLETYPRRP